MKLSASHDFDAPRDAVQDALVDPEFWRALRLPDVAPPSVVRAADGRVELAMEWAGTLDALGRRIVGTEHVTWTQTITVDRAAHRGVLDIASSLRVHVSCRGTFRLDAVDGGRSTRRSLDAELSVRVPLVGRQAEQRLAPGIRRRLDGEAAALRAWLTRA